MISVAIDGPAGAGKSSIAKELAKKLGYIYIDTGAIYRAFALYIINNNIDPLDSEKVSKSIDSAEIEIEYIKGSQRTFLNKEDVSEKIRSSDVSMVTSQIAINLDVRAALIELQRNLAKNHNVIMDGRDIGTVVLKDADVKIYLTASPEERAKRRVLQLEKQGIHENVEDVYKQILERDYNDINISGALKQAKDAILVDNTSKAKEETIQIIFNIVKDKTNE